MKDVSPPIDTAPVARKRPEPSQPRNSGAYFRLSNFTYTKSVFLSLPGIDPAPHAQSRGSTNKNSCIG